MECQAVYVTSADNIVADAISRYDFHRFRLVHPNANINMVSTSDINYFGNMIISRISLSLLIYNYKHCIYFVVLILFNFVPKNRVIYPSLCSCFHVVDLDLKANSLFQSGL